MDKRTRKEAQPPTDVEAGQFPRRELTELLRNLHTYSPSDWTEKTAALWTLHVELCLASEVAALESQGLQKKDAQKLVRTAWVRRCPDTGNLIREALPTRSSTGAVPVVLVFRNGGFVIHESITDHLRDHPLLSNEGEELPDLDPRESVLRLLAEVDALEEELGLGHLALFHAGDLLPVHAGEDCRAADCGYAAHRLRCLLDPRHREPGDKEDLEWLALVQGSTRFWRLLSTAISLGEAMERRRVLDEKEGEQTLRRMATAPPGKQTSEQGEAIESMIEAYALNTGTTPTPDALKQWLGAVRPYSDNDPLTVDHPLWTAELKGITWPRFQQVVKEAKRRMQQRRL